MNVHLPPKLRHRLRVQLLLAICGCGLLQILPTAGAQTAITSWVLTHSDVANSTSYAAPGPITFQNQTNAVTSISYGTSGGWLDPNVATAAYVRRSGVTGASANNSNIWEVQNTSATNLLGLDTSAMTLNNVLMGNNALMGVNDMFTNTGGNPAPANNNIERIDYYWAAGFSAVRTDGFAVFERGVVNQHDGFKIAAITGWNTTTNTPTSYSGNIVSVTSATYGASNLDWDPTTAGVQQTFANYDILRFNGTGDNLTPLNLINPGTTQGVAGVFISLADLGITAGTTIYGYSIIGPDYTSTVANLVNWNNATFYPTTTPDTTGSIDLLSFGGRRIVPEPSTYGALFIGLTAAFLGWRRWRRGLSARAA